MTTAQHPLDEMKYWNFNQPGAQVMRDVQSFTTAIQRGLVPGASIFGAYGRRVSTAQLTPHTLWPGPTPRQPYLAAGEPLEIVSSSPADALGGAGTQVVEVHYIKFDGTATSDIIELAGNTAVPLSVNGRFIQCTHAIKGTYAVGNISVRDVGTGSIVYSFIPAGEIRCSSSARFIPAGKRFFMTDRVGGSASGTSASRDEIWMVSTELDQHKLLDEGIYMPHNGVTIQDMSLTASSTTLFMVSSEQIVAMEYISEKGSTITASYAGWIEDE